MVRKEIRQRDDIHIDHTTPQARRQGLRVPSENIHDKGPAAAGECGPGVIVNLGPGFGGEERGEGVHVGFDSEFAEGQHHASEDVDDNLERS